MNATSKLALRPVAVCTRASLIAREVSLSLSSAAVEILFSRSHVLSEGHTERGAYFGSTMITFDLSRIGDLVTDGAAPDVAERVSALCAGDDRIRDRARNLALAEAEKLAGGALADAQIDVAVSARGVHVHLDIDVSAPATRVAEVG